MHRIYWSTDYWTRVKAQCTHLVWVKLLEGWLESVSWRLPKNIFSTLVDHCRCAQALAMGARLLSMQCILHSRWRNRRHTPDWCLKCFQRIKQSCCASQYKGFVTTHFKLCSQYVPATGEIVYNTWKRAQICWRRKTRGSLDDDDLRQNNSDCEVFINKLPPFLCEINEK